MTYTAELKFTTRTQAQEFARAWAFYSYTGHTMTSGSENVTVKIYDIDDAKKAWIDQYVSTLNA